MFNARGEKYSVCVANIKEHLEGKTATDLLEELHQEFDAAEGRGEVIDIELYYAYMDVINEIEPLKEKHSIDPTVLFRQVQEKHPELFSDSEHVPETKHKVRPKFRMKRVISIAAVICILAIILTVAAYGGKTMTGFISFGGDLFQIGNVQSGQMELDQPAENGYHSLAEALEAYGVSGIEPTWIPADYSLISVEVAEVAAYIHIAAGYGNGEDRLTIRITVYTDGKLPESTYERNEEYDDIYRVNGTDHFLMLNNKRKRATWEQRNCLCDISGFISESQLKEMIDSIYER